MKSVHNVYYNDGQKNGEGCFKLTDGAKYDDKWEEDMQEGCTLVQKLIFILSIFIFNSKFNKVEFIWL